MLNAIIWVFRVIGRSKSGKFDLLQYSANQTKKSAIPKNSNLLILYFGKMHTPILSVCRVINIFESPPKPFRGILIQSYLFYISEKMKCRRREV